jgi:hypothetical protein
MMIQFTIVLAVPIMNWHIAFAGVLVLKKDAPKMLHWNFDIDFMKHVQDGMLVSSESFRKD